MNSIVTYWKRANPSRNRKLRCKSKRRAHSTASARSGSPTFPSYHIRAAYGAPRRNHIHRSPVSRAQLPFPRSPPFHRCSPPLARRSLEVQQPSTSPKGGTVFVAFRDIRFAKGRFALMGSVIALLTLLIVLLSGLTAGLADQSTSAIRNLPADHEIGREDF